LKIKLNSLAALCLLMLVPGCATGDYLVSGQTRAKIAYEGVEIFTNIPSNAVVIGMVSASNPDRLAQHWHPELKKIRQEAALIGANGVVIKRETWHFFRGESISGFAFYIP
jgi:hypothetical protein